jgi:hypothetical protein
MTSHYLLSIVKRARILEESGSTTLPQSSMNEDLQMTQEFRILKPQAF